jgi:hypothetical protein
VLFALPRFYSRGGTLQLTVGRSDTPMELSSNGFDRETTMLEGPAGSGGLTASTCISLMTEKLVASTPRNVTVSVPARLPPN